MVDDPLISLGGPPEHSPTLAELAQAVETRLEAYDAWVRNEPAPCPGCGRPLAARSPRCIYCGHREG